MGFVCRKTFAERRGTAVWCTGGWLLGGVQRFPEAVREVEFDEMRDSEGQTLDDVTLDDVNRLHDVTLKCGVEEPSQLVIDISGGESLCDVAEAPVLPICFLDTLEWVV